MADRQRLAAILALDIEDYASFETSNKKAALFHLRSLLGVVRTAVDENRGTLFSVERDIFLAEFPNPVAAIRAGTMIHENVAAYNDEQKEAQRMSFRAAVHVGGVLDSGGKLSGEATSFAQVLKSYAYGGSTAIAGETHKQVEERVDLEWEDLGKQAVDGWNVSVLRGVENIDVYASEEVHGRLAAGLSRRGIAAIALGIVVTLAAAVLLFQQENRLGSGDDKDVFQQSARLGGGNDEGEIEGSGADKEATEVGLDGLSITVSMALPSQPSFAVLPFAAASSDHSQDHLKSGLAQEVAVALSQSQDLFVASPHSALMFAASNDAVPEAARVMGVRFILLGKVNRVGNRIRLSVQLMENGIPSPLFVRSFDLEAEQLSGIGRRVAQLAASAVGSPLTASEINRLKRQEALNFEAFDLLLRGHNALRQENKAATDEAIRLFEEAVDEDPSFARAYEGLAIAHMSAQQWAGASPSARAFEAAQQAVALDDRLSAAHSILGASYLAKRDHDRAIQSAEKAVAVNPNAADGYAMLGRILSWSGLPERGKEQIKKALRRNPRPPFGYLFGLGHARFLAQDYKGAIVAFRRGVQTHPNWLPNRYYLAASYAHAGDPFKAEFELGQGAVRTVMPSVIAGDLTPYRDIADLKHFMEAMRKAGVR